MHAPENALSLFDLTGRVALVTGASAGLGSRFLRVLASAGADVVAAARRTDRIASLAAELSEDTRNPSRAIAVGCDVSVADDRQRLIETATAEFGHIDIVVNNAGILNPVWAKDETLDDWRQVVEVNLTAVWDICRMAGTQMMEQGHGVLVNIASMYGLVARGDVPIGASYPATKGAVVNLTRELGTAWARHGVRVNAIAPGYFPTEMTESTMGDDRFSERQMRKCPLRRVGEAHELDGILLFLCSDASSYVVGQTIAVDGGWTAW